MLTHRREPIKSTCVLKRVARTNPASSDNLSIKSSIVTKCKERILNDSYDLYERLSVTLSLIVSLLGLSLVLMFLVLVSILLDTLGHRVLQQIVPLVLYVIIHRRHVRFHCHGFRML